MTEILIEGQKVKVSDDFLSLPPDKQAETVEQIAAQIGVSADNRGAADRFVRSASDAIGGFVDSMAGPVNKGANAVIRGGADLVGVEDPFQFNETPSHNLIDNNDLGLGRPPEGIIERAGQGAGFAASTLIPAAKGFELASKGTGVMAGVSKNFLDALRTIPGALIEIGSGATAGAGGEIAAEIGGEDKRALGEVIGGLGFPLATSGVGAASQAARKLPLVGAGVDTVQRTILPMGGEGSRVAASKRVRSLVPDPEASAARLEGKKPGNLTPAQETGDAGLAALENRLALENPEFSKELTGKVANSARILRDELKRLGGNGNIDDAVDFISTRRSAFKKRLSGIIDAAQTRADKRVSKLTPKRQQSENSVIVREEIDKAFGQARAQEKVLWDRVPKNVKVPTDASRTRFTALVNDTPTSLADDIPDEARRFFTSNSQVGDETTVNEMLGLVSKMRKEARVARGGETPNENMGRIADLIADGVLDDLEKIATNSPRVAKAVTAARTFSRELAETFKQGAVNTARARRGTGRGSVPPESVLSSTIGAGGPRAAVNARDLTKGAKGITPDTTGRVATTRAAREDFVRGRASDATVRDGQVSPRAAETFQNQNRDLLNEVPAVRKDLQAATSATKDVKSATDRVADITKRLNDKRLSVDEAFLSATPGNEVGAAIFASRNPTSSARKIRNAASKDPTGRSLDGIKDGVINHLIKGSRGSGLDAENVPVISGIKLKAALQDPKTRSAIAQIFEPADLRRMDKISDQLIKVENSIKSGTTDSIINDNPNMLITMAARIFGANIGAAQGRGGASIQTANMGASRAKALVAALTNDRAETLLVEALKDRELMSALLLNLDKPKNAARVKRFLAPSLVGTASALSNKEPQK